MTGGGGRVAATCLRQIISCKYSNFIHSIFEVKSGGQYSVHTLYSVLCTLYSALRTPYSKILCRTQLSVAYLVRNGTYKPLVEAIRNSIQFTLTYKFCWSIHRWILDFWNFFLALHLFSSFLLVVGFLFYFLRLQIGIKKRGKKAGFEFAPVDLRS